MIQVTIKQLDTLWADVIKARAEYRSELTGREGKQIDGIHVLNAHHLLGKPTIALRYSLENGMCLTKGEHKFEAHGEYSRQEKFKQRVIQLRGNVFEELKPLKYKTGKLDKMAMKLYLENELKKYEKM